MQKDIAKAVKQFLALPRPIQIIQSQFLLQYRYNILHQLLKAFIKISRCTLHLPPITPPSDAGCAALHQDSCQLPQLPQLPVLSVVFFRPPMNEWHHL
ncbi:hypothetical protein ACQRIU_002751 [Beauveria bassiana]